MTRISMANNVIERLVDGVCILSAAFCDKEGFTIYRTSNEFSPNAVSEILDYSNESELTTIVGEINTVMILRIESGHFIVIQCPNNSNFGKARQKLRLAGTEIIAFL